MFTGLVERQGVVGATAPKAGGLGLTIEAPGWEHEVRTGDSIAVNGCCLTVVGATAGGLEFDVVPETVQRTGLADLEPGEAVNLERALRLGDRLGGHLVQGHVDGVGTVEEVKDEGDGRRIAFELPRELERFVAEKGSIALDGVSLTVAACRGPRLEVAFVPHTLAVTVAGRYRPGRRVNVEVDLIARYVVRARQAEEER